jgi:hypothetical protein
MLLRLLYIIIDIIGGGAIFINIDSNHNLRFSQLIKLIFYKNNPRLRHGGIKYFSFDIIFIFV